MAAEYRYSASNAAALLRGFSKHIRRRSAHAGCAIAAHRWHTWSPHQRRSVMRKILPGSAVLFVLAALSGGLGSSLGASGGGSSSTVIWPGTLGGTSSQ